MIRRLFFLLLTLAVCSACSRNKIETPQGPVGRTVLMYFPWAQDLATYTKKNIEDMERVVAQGALHDERLLVFYMDSHTTASLRSTIFLALFTVFTMPRSMSLRITKGL